MNPLVSVIIPAWNAEKLIKETIESALNQTYPNIEIIVVDDGSTDDTAEVVKSIKDPRITYHYQENTGLPACGRNKGAKLAKGEYLAFLDSDDIWLPQKIARQMKIMEENPNTALVSTNCWYIIVDKKTSISAISKIKSGYLTNSTCFPKNAMINSTVLIKKNILDQIGGHNESPAMRASEDYDLFSRIFLKYPCYFLNEYLAYYRTGLPSISGNKAQMIQRDLKHYYEYFLSYGLPEKINKKRYSYLTLERAFNQLESGEKSWSKTLRKSVSLSPSAYGLIRYGFSFLPTHFAAYLNRIKNRKWHSFNN